MDTTTKNYMKAITIYGSFGGRERKVFRSLQLLHIYIYIQHLVHLNVTIRKCSGFHFFQYINNDNLIYYFYRLG